MSKSPPKRCPQCGATVEPKSKNFPFCSERCQLLDLGAWANEKYRVAAMESELDSDSDEE